MTTSNPPRGYMNSLSRPPPCGTTGGQLSDPDSGCFSSSGNETWFDPHNGHGGHQMLSGTTMDSSPLSSSGSSMMSHPQSSNNTRLLAHTLENRKRVLQTLIREKADTLV